MKQQELGPYQEAWVLSLESNWFKQGTGSLCRFTNGEWLFCCLGVACEMLIANDVPIDSCALPVSIRSPESIIWTYDGRASSMSSVTMHILKLRSDIGSFRRLSAPTWVLKKLDACGNIKTSEHFSLAELNDNGNFNFKEIARFIRECPHLIFTEPA